MSALLEPAGVGRDVGLGLEGQRADVVHEERHALLGQGGPEGVHGLERRVELHQARRGPWPSRAMRGSSSASSERRRRDGVGRLPLEEGPGHRVEPEQHGEQAGAGARQPDDDPRALDPLLAHLGVRRRPLVQRDAVGQRAGEHLGDQDAPEGASGRPRPRRRARNTSSGSRKRSLPRSSEPAVLTAAATIDTDVSEGRFEPEPGELRARPRSARAAGRLRSSESRHV